MCHRRTSVVTCNSDHRCLTCN